MLENSVVSVIVTGCSGWTVYQHSHYRGPSLCLHPGQADICTPGFYPRPGLLTRLRGGVASARRGCFSHIHLHPEPQTGSVEPAPTRK